MSQGIEEKYLEPMKVMMAIAGVANRAGLDPKRNLAVYDAWSLLYPSDAYTWLSKAIIEFSDDNIDKAQEYVRDAVACAKTSRDAAEEAAAWLADEKTSGHRAGSLTGK